MDAATIDTYTRLFNVVEHVPNGDIADDVDDSGDNDGGNEYAKDD